MGIAIVDIGNTYCKGAYFHEGTPQFVTVTTNVESLFAWLKKFPIEKVICASVRKGLDRSQLETLGYDVITIHSSMAYPPIKNRYETIDTLGVDRWCNVVGAHALGYAFPYFVIDLGTAITGDYVNAEGEYLGGFISPGIGLRFSALHKGTERLPFVFGYRTPPFPGKNTKESIQLGVLRGILHEISGWSKWLPENTTVIVTGGDSFWASYFLGKEVYVEPFLTFVGAYALSHVHGDAFRPNLSAGSDEHHLSV